LLRDLGPQLTRGSHAGTAHRAAAPLCSGIPAIDALLKGGLPRGRLSEIAGPASSGRTSVALALLAHATRAGEVVAVVDAADAFDPTSAAAAGIPLERLLWARPPESREAVHCSQRLLETRGFALVVLDLQGRAAPAQRTDGGRRWAPPPLPRSVWQRLARTTAATGTALLVLSPSRQTGSFAEVALEMRRRRAHFTDTPSLLDSLEIEVCVARRRDGPLQHTAPVRLGTRDLRDGRAA
jgi:hypothetical protein